LIRHDIDPPRAGDFIKSYASSRLVKMVMMRDQPHSALKYFGCVLGAVTLANAGILLDADCGVLWSEDMQDGIAIEKGLVSLIRSCTPNSSNSWSNPAKP
jgi:hypothetical protein